MRIRKQIFCLRSNLNNDDIISTQRPGLKEGAKGGTEFSVNY